MKTQILRIAAAALSLTVMGCATTQKVRYELEGTALVTNSPLATKSVLVASFRDERNPFQDATRGSDKRTVKFQGKTWYVNEDGRYKDKTPIPSIATMMAEHLGHAAIFESVTADAGAETDYVLEGTVRKFEGYKESSSAAVVGSQFGLLGALATSGVKSGFIGATELTDVQLKRRSDGTVVWTGSGKGEMEGEDYADAYGWSAYQKANDSLKLAVDELIGQLRDVLERAVKARDAR